MNHHNHHLIQVMRVPSAWGTVAGQRPVLPDRGMREHAVRMKWTTTGFAVAALCVGLMGCGTDSDSDSKSTTSTTEAGKEAVCSARDDLKQSITDLGDLSVRDEGKSGVEAAVGDVSTSFEELEAAASDAYKPQIDAVKPALEDLQTAVGNLGQGDLGQEVQDVGKAIADVTDTTTTLFTTIEEDCPS